MGQSDLRHRLVAEVKEIASLLGHTPTRDEYRQHSKIGEKSYRKLFGGFTPLLMAAGLKKNLEKFHPNDIFKTEVEYHSTEGVAPAKPKIGISNNILVLGDTHFPWVSLEALSAVYVYIEKHPEIDTVIQIGDLYDLYSWAKFPRSHLIYNPKQELEQARLMAEDMWKKVQKLLPNARCIQLLGNHDIRPIKKCLELAPELELFLEFKKFFVFENVELVEDPREPLQLNGINFIHGFLSGLGAHTRKYLQSTVCGHTHKGGVVMVVLGDGKVLFEANAGYLGDPLARPLSYTPSKLKEWTHGLLHIDEWGPKFVSL